MIGILNDKIALVTGASRGIGRAIALGFAREGAKLGLISRSFEALKAVAREIEVLGGETLCLPADLGFPETTSKAVDDLVKHFGRLDILVNNVGISPVVKKSEELELTHWEETIRINLTGTFLITQSAGKAMIRQQAGKIINITSVGGTIALPRQLAYCVTKGGIIQMTKVLAVEWARYNIQVNAIGPGYVETDLTEGMRTSKIISENLLKRTPMHRFAKPEEIVGAAVFLASDGSSYITGQTVFVDGGWLAA